MKRILLAAMTLFPLTAQAQLNCSGGALYCNGAPTGTGVAVLQTSPSLVTPTLGVATATSVSIGGATPGGSVYIYSTANSDVVTELQSTANSGTVANYFLTKTSGATDQQWRIGTQISIGDGRYEMYDSTRGAAVITLTTTGVVAMPNYGAGTATFSASGVISSVSDGRVKDVQGPFTAGLKEIREIQPVLFKYNRLGVELFGMKNPDGSPDDNVYVSAIAQEVKRYIPEAVGLGSSGYYSLNSSTIGFAAINAIKELEIRIIALEAKAGMDSDLTKAVPIDNDNRIIKPPKIVVAGAP